MSITSDLEQILSARYGEEVRQAIHDSIEEGYNIAVQAQGTAETSQDSAEAYAAAALASEQNAHDYMELAEQYKNEAFSGTPTGYSDLVAKVNSIYKETASSFGVVGTVEGLALAHTIYGMSEQDGTPTPSVPVEIQSAKADFRCVGKNLVPYPLITNQTLDEGQIFNHVTMKYLGKNQFSFVGTSTGRVDCRLLYPYQHKALNVGTYKLTIVHKSGSKRQANISIEYSIGQTYNKTKARVALDANHSIVSTTFTVTQEEIDTYNMAFILYGANGQTYDDIYEVELTLADVSDTTYEPYQSKSITTDLTLRAIEVTSSDDYNLVKDGKYYIADTLDWDEDNGYSITRRIGYTKLRDTSIQLTNSAWGESNTATSYGFADGSLTNMKSYANDSVIAPILSDISVASSRNLMYNSDSKNGHHYYGGWGFTILITSGLYTTTEAFLSAFGDNYIQYPLATPTTETITSAQAQALLGLKTYDEATSIDATGDVAPSVTLEYSKDRTTALGLMAHNLAHINSLKIADLSS